MTALLRKYGLFYLAHTVTFFFLCAYSLAADAPNYPYLPALFLPIYLSAAVATRGHGHGNKESAHHKGMLPRVPQVPDSAHASL